MWNELAARLPYVADPVTSLLIFFIYSFGGYVMECVVLSVEKRQLVLNRGFTNHLPLCVIYGFGAMMGFALLRPLSHNPALLFIVGAVFATSFEYLTARIQIRLFGDFWWDYTQKPFNYKGILCLESTLAWGVAAIVVVLFVHGHVVRLARMVPLVAAKGVVIFLLSAYVLDFALSARAARAKELPQTQQEEQDPVVLNKYK